MGCSGLIGNTTPKLLQFGRKLMYLAGGLLGTLEDIVLVSIALRRRSDISHSLSSLIVTTLLLSHSFALADISVDGLLTYLAKV